jgi:NADPH:quinone reductase-like Zn-dependent oxidoreductase
MALSRETPRTMRAVYLTGHGGYEQLRVVDDAPVPHPGADEVLVKLGAAAINNTDINLRSAWYSKSITNDARTAAAGAATQATDGGWDGTAVRFPLIQGADGCGKVVSVGPGADAGLIGTRVLIDPIVRISRAAAQRVEYLGTDRNGCFAEYITVPACNAVAIQSSLSDAQLASFPCSYLAAENMLARAKIGNHDRVLITGASGGVGSAAVQLARRRGAHITAMAARDKMAAIAELGANRVLPRDAEIVGELGVDSLDAVIDCVGGAQFPNLLSVLKAFGRYAVAGAIAGPIVELDLRTLYLKDLSMLGCTVAEAQTFRDVARYIERGEIRPLIARTFPLQHIVEAQQAFLAKQHIGKIVLEI